MANSTIKLETSGQEETITILQQSPSIHQASQQTVTGSQPQSNFSIAQQQPSSTPIHMSSTGGVRPQGVSYQNIQQLPFLQAATGGQIIQNANGMFQVVQPVSNDFFFCKLVTKITFR